MPYCYAIFLPPPFPPPSTAPRLRAREINVRPVCTPISLDRAPPIISANCLSDSNAELISRIHTPRTGRGNNRLDPIVRRVEACKSNQKLLLSKKDRYRRLTQYLADRGLLEFDMEGACQRFAPSSKDQAANRPRRVDIRNRRRRRLERGDDGWSKRGLNAWRTYASTGSRGAYLSILRGSVEHMCRASDGEHWRQLSPRPEMLENVPAGGSRVEGRSRQLAVAVACMHVPRGRYVNTRGRRRGDGEGTRHDERVAVRPALPLLPLFSLARELA